MTEPVTLDPGAYIDQIGKQWLTEVGQLRQVDVPKPDAGPVKLYEALLEVRGRLDRVEGILGQAMALRSGAEMSAREKADVAADALDAAIKKHSSRAREYEGSRERIAAASVDTIVQAQQARAARKLADLAGSLEARIRLAHRGLDTTRTDLIAALRHVNWESSLDR